MASAVVARSGRIRKAAHGGDDDKDGPFGGRVAIDAEIAEVRLYDHLFAKENPDDVNEGENFRVHLNPDSLEVITHCKMEPSLGETKPLDRYQFERLGYFCTDPDSTPSRLVFNRTVGLRDAWAKLQKQKQNQKQGQKS